MSSRRTSISFFRCIPRIEVGEECIGRDCTNIDADERHGFVNLYNQQVDEELYSAPKLKKRHIHWRDNKMKVKLAAQLFSSSVSAALLYAKEKNIPQFQTCEGTAKFCAEFDDIFNMFNSWTTFNKQLKPKNDPIRLSNKNGFKLW